MVEGVAWQENRQGLVQLCFNRGPLLRTVSSSEPARGELRAEDSLGTIEVKEIRSSNPAEWHLVRQFYQLWSGDTFSKPSPKELTLARELLKRHGGTTLHAILPLTVKRVKEQWPDAKTFAAIARYLPEINDEYERRQRITEKQKDEHLREQVERERQSEERQTQQEILDRCRPEWLALSPQDRAALEQSVRQEWPHIARIPASFERYCILEFARRQPSEAETIRDARSIASVFSPEPRF